MYFISFIRENEVLIQFNPFAFLFHIIDFNLKRINLYPHKKFLRFFYNYIFFNNIYIFKKLSFDVIMRTERTLVKRNMLEHTRNTLK